MVDANEAVGKPVAGLGSVRRLPRLWWAAIQLVWAAGRRELLVSLALRSVGGAALGVILLLSRGVLDKVLAAGQSSTDLANALPWVLVLTCVTAAAAFTGAFSREMHTILSGLVGRHAQEQIVEVASAMELEAYENPAFHDRLMRAAAGGQQQPMQIVEGLLGLVSSTVGIAGISIALLTVQPWLVPIVVAAVLPLLAAAARAGELLFNFYWHMAPTDRERNYIYGLLTGKEAAKEVRAFGLAGFLGSRYRHLYQLHLAELRRTARRRLWVSLQGALIMSVVLACTATGLLWLSAHDRLDLAEAGVAIAATLLLAERLMNGVASAGTLYEAARFVEDFTSFVGLKPVVEVQQRNAAPTAFSRLVVEDVSFTYPSGHDLALRGVSMAIRRGEIVALVGENGSGKTTLAKLLCRLYRPQQGRILWDGVDIGAVDADQLRGSIAVIFQDFLRYALSARANIGLGRHAWMEDHGRVVAAARQAGADSFLAELPNGYDTILSPEYEGGEDLSIGQWQRVALARAFFRDAPFIILDEPTAALDARAEHELFEAIRTLCHGHSVLLISHRFSSVRSADHVYVLDAGRIVEHGTHDQLMRNAGRYAELFTLQASAYLLNGDGHAPVRPGDPPFGYDLLPDRRD
jgi:ATP-binding cassette, subfamily B, bacterial